MRLWGQESFLLEMLPEIPGTIHSMISGYYAGEVAVRAIKDHNIEILFEFKNILKNSDIYKAPYCWRQVDKFYGSYKNCLHKFNNIEV